jgi:predicted permease
MRRLRQFSAKLRALARRGRSERVLEKEMAAHLAMIEEDLRRQGLSAEEARFAAQRAFGGVEQAKARYRDQRGFVWLEQFRQDAWHAGRTLRKSPGFATVAILSLAFGIGANTTIFTLVNGVLLKRLSIPEAERVVQLEARGETWTGGGLSYPQFRELRRQTSIFSDVAGFRPNRAVLDLGGNPQQTDIELVTGNYFSFFHAEPALGRLLEEQDDAVEGAHPVCVLSYQAWRSRFGADPRVLGRIVRINTIPFQIVGVVRPDFVGAEMQRRYEIWAPTAMALPLTWNARRNPHFVWLRSLAKLRRGLTVPEAHSRLRAASRGINEVLPKERANADAVFAFVGASKGFDSFRTRLRQPLLILMGAVTLVLLIACANLTNLLLARGNERTQEFSMKLSLGISRWRLMRQLLIENLLLTLVGGIVAIIAARELVAVLLALFNAGERWQVLSVSMDPVVLTFTFAVCGLTTVIVGLYPALSAIRTDMTPMLKGGSATGMQKRFVRRVMIVVQVSLAVVLLFGAIVFSHSLRKLKTVDLGFDIQHVAVIGIDFHGKEPVIASPGLHDVLNRTRQIPGVESADLANPGALSGMSMTSDDVEAGEGSKSGTTRKAENTYFVFTSSQYFSTLRMPLLRGRDFSERDRKGSPAVAIINQHLASLLWPGKNPLGREIIGGWNRENPEVIGVVGNSKYSNVRESIKPIIYEPLDQMPVMSASLEVRSRMPVAQIDEQVRKLVGSDAPGFQVANVSTMELLRDNVIAQDRLLTFLSVLFGVLGTMLALVGIYGLISYSVIRRTREIGIRMSVGAQQREVLQLFMREVILLVGFGAVIGLSLVLIVSKPLKIFLYEVPAADPLGIALTFLLIALGSLAASFLPARRAMRVDPVEALRHE